MEKLLTVKETTGDSLYLTKHIFETVFKKTKEDLKERANFD